MNFDIKTKEAFTDTLSYLCDHSELQISKQKQMLIEFKDKLIETSLNYTELLDGFVVGTLVSYQLMKGDKIYLSSFDSFIKFGNFISIMTQKLGLTNQIISNYICTINKVADSILSNTPMKYELNDKTFMDFFYLIQIDIEITQNVQAYNPKVVIYLERLLHYIITNNDHLQTINIDNKYINKNEKINVCSYIHENISNFMYSYAKLNQNDLNFDIMFNSLYSIIKHELLSKQKKSTYKNTKG